MEATLSATPLFNQVRVALIASPYFSSHEVQVETSDGHVRLQGTVGTFYQKQMAQELVRRVDGVEIVENKLQVNWG
jgi:osmotically-inducible protein OsmY